MALQQGVRPPRWSTAFSMEMQLVNMSKGSSAPESSGLLVEGSSSSMRPAQSAMHVHAHSAAVPVTHAQDVREILQHAPTINVSSTQASPACACAVVAGVSDRKSKRRGRLRESLGNAQQRKCANHKKNFVVMLVFLAIIGAMYMGFKTVTGKASSRENAYTILKINPKKT